MAGPELMIGGRWGVRIFAGVTALLLLLCFIFCMAKGWANAGSYLLAFNVIFSAVIAGFIARWYSTGELNNSKLWYVLALGSLLMVQTIVYDVHAFHYPRSSDQVSTTTASTAVDASSPAEASSTTAEASTTSTEASTTSTEASITTTEAPTTLPG